MKTTLLILLAIIICLMSVPGLAEEATVPEAEESVPAPAPVPAVENALPAAAPVSVPAPANMLNANEYQECAAVMTWLIRGNDTDAIDQKKTVKIPFGWTIVGTGIAVKTPVIFICR